VKQLAELFGLDGRGRLISIPKPKAKEEPKNEAAAA